MKLTKIFFDLDGTLLDTWLRSYAAYKSAIAILHGIFIDFEEFVNLKREGEDNNKLLINSGINEENIEPYNNLVANFIEQPSLLAYDKLYDWVEQILSSVNKDGDLFLLTSRQNKENCERQLSSLKIEYAFKRIFIVHDKYEALKHFASEDLIMVTDNESDLILGSKIGYISVAVTWGHRKASILERYNPTYVIDMPQDLPSLLKEISLHHNRIGTL